MRPPPPLLVTTESRRQCLASHWTRSWTHSTAAESTTSAWTLRALSCLSSRPSTGSDLTSEYFRLSSSAERSVGLLLILLTSSGVVEYKVSATGSCNFSDRHCKFSTELQQTVAKIPTKAITSTQNFYGVLKCFILRFFSRKFCTFLSKKCFDKKIFGQFSDKQEFGLHGQLPRRY